MGMQGRGCLISMVGKVGTLVPPMLSDQTHGKLQDLKPAIKPWPVGVRCGIVINYSTALHCTEHETICVGTGCVELVDDALINTVEASL